MAKKNSPSSLFSPWYSDSFVREKVENRSVALTKREQSGELSDAKEWDLKARRRFEGLWQRLSDETKRSYQSAARHFGNYLGLSRMDSKVSNIVARLILLSYMESSTLVEEYVMWMEQDLELAPNTINVRLAALRWFVDSARRVGWVEYKLDIKNVKGGNVRDTSGPSDAELRRILRVVNSAEGAGAMRNRLLVYMLAFMALRISSVISLDMENIDFEKRRMKVKWKGKGDRVANYVWRPIGPETLEALNDWLDIRGRHDGPIFVSVARCKSQSGRLSVRSGQRIIKEIGQEAATKKKLHPHAFRHFHITDALKQGENTRDVMKSSGHTNIKTIEYYDDSDDSKAREIAAGIEKRWLSDLSALEEADEEEIQERYKDKQQDDDEDRDEVLEDFGIVTAVQAAAEAAEYSRLSTGMDGVDSLLGGRGDEVGIVRGSLVLLGGYPGIGKSTLARQICFNICENNPGERVLYASGEESAEQIGEALARLECKHDNLLLFPEKSINRICKAAEAIKASVLVVDSVSTVAVDECNKSPGSISQVKEIGHYLLSWCKGVGDEEGSSIAVIVISHVDKKGNIAGPKALEHHVDAVFSFMSPSKRSKMRSLGCEGKNRFGDATKEIYFEMTSRGLVEQEPANGSDDFDYDDEDSY